LAHLDKFDKIYLVTGDTDLVPAVKMVKKEFPHKQIGVLYPYNRKNRELSKVTDTASYTQASHLVKFRLSEEIPRKGKSTIFCPPEWREKLMLPGSRSGIER